MACESFTRPSQDAAGRRTSGAEAVMQAELRACFLVLDRMKRRGLYPAPPIAQSLPRFTRA